jgi:hypothetical protein
MEFCDLELCRLVQSFSPAKNDRIQERLISHLKGDGGPLREFPLGTLGQLRQRADCPCCNFMLANIETCDLDQDTLADDAWCHAELRGDNIFRVRMRRLTGLYDCAGLGRRNVVVDDELNPSPAAGRALTLGSVDYGLFRNWIGLCDELHTTICRETVGDAQHRANVPHCLRVIDVAEHRLADIAWDDQYVALSYVWGTAKQLKLQSNKVSQFYSSGYLLEVQDSIPRTIRDAMSLTHGLGLRYLWVDALCLVQDAGDDVMKGVMIMDLIYERAYVTILAAEGNSAEAGLPGVGLTPRLVQQNVVPLKPGLSIMCVESLDRHLNRSYWASRGWTFQEQYLSRRTIAFVGGLTFFRCRQRVWSEETWTDRDPELSPEQDTDMNYITIAQREMDQTSDFGATFEYLFASIARFQTRALSKEGDALIAMAGISQRVAALVNTSMVMGLPACIFPIALCFNSNDPPYQRRHEFPSWSWAGWKGRQLWLVTDQLEIFEGPDDWKNACRQTVAVIQNYNCQNGGSLPRTLWKTDFTHLHSIWPAVQIPLQGLSAFVTKYDPFEAYTIPNSAAHLLYITSVVVYASFGQQIKSYLFNVEDPDGQMCGYIIPDVEFSNRSKDRLKFLVIALAYKKHDFWNSIDPERPIDPPQAVWALLIARRDGSKIYERQGVALLYQSYVEKCMLYGPCWETVILG